jgi:hypothetical protein
VHGKNEANKQTNKYLTMWQMCACVKAYRQRKKKSQHKAQQFLFFIFFFKFILRFLRQ